MMRLPRQIKIKCPHCNGVDLLTNLRPAIRDHKIQLACNKCRTEMHITEAQIEEWKEKAKSLKSYQEKKK